MTAAHTDHPSLSDYESRCVLPLLQDSLLGDIEPRALARLLPHLRTCDLAAGEILFRHGASADALYLLLQGSLQLMGSDNAPSVPVTQGCLGEEAALPGQRYLADCRALEPCRLLLIPRASLRAVIADSPALQNRFHAALLQRHSGQQLLLPAQPRDTEKSEASWTSIGGWLITALAPVGVLLAGPSLALDVDALAFLAVLSAVICMWMFSLVDEYLPGLFAILATLTLGLVPVDVPLSGFASDSFFMAMSILGLGTVIVSSGLSYRCLLWLLSHMPNNRFGQHTGLLLTGIFLTPLVPSINGRVALVAPLFRDMLDILQAPPRSRVTTQLAVGAFSGITLLSAGFMSSKSVNFVVYGMLPSQWQDQFQWLFWLLASLVVGGVTLLLYALLVLLGFRDRWRRHATTAPPRLRVNPQQLQAQRKLMGALRDSEWAAVLGILVFMLGVGTASLHHIDPPWLGLAVLYGLLMFGFLRKDEFRQKIDWPFLVYLGGISGIVATFNYLGLDAWLARDLNGLASVLQGNLELFIVLLAVLVLLVRLVVPISATIVLLATVFVPLADSVGVNPWVVGFIVLVLGELWFFPYQCSYYQQFRQLAGAGDQYDERAFLRFNALMNLAKVAALFASLPYWRSQGLL